MDISAEFESNQILLMLLSGETYNDVSVEVAKELSKSSVGYVTLNKTNSSLDEILSKKGVETQNIIYIDAITNTIKPMPKQGCRVYYVTSPSALTELSVTISKLLAHNFDYVIFDSLTNLLIYESKAPLAKFVQSLINKIRESNTKAVFYVLKTKEHEELIDECELLVDKVIDLTSRK